MLAAISFSPTDGIAKADSTHVLTMTCVQVFRASLVILVNMYLRMCERISQGRNCQVLGSVCSLFRKTCNAWVLQDCHTHTTELATSATCAELPMEVSMRTTAFNEKVPEKHLCLTCICSKQTLTVLAKILNFWFIWSTISTWASDYTSLWRK